MAVPAIVLHAAIGLLPVLAFLAALLYLDSYKLVRLRIVIAIVDIIDGVGLMGHGIAQEFAVAGYEVRMHDTSDENLDRAMTRIRANLTLMT